MFKNHNNKNFKVAFTTWYALNCFKKIFKWFLACSTSQLYKNDLQWENQSALDFMWGTQKFRGGQNF